MQTSIEARFRAVVDGFNDPILILDPFQIVRYVNAEFLAVFGYALADVIGRPFAGLYPPAEHQAIAARLASCQPSPGVTLRFEHSLLTRDGTAELVEASVNPLPAPGGEPTVIIHLRVITERRGAEAALRASEERYRHLVEHSHDLIQSVAPDGRVLFANRTWLATLGYLEAELPGLSLGDVVHPDALGDLEHDLAALWGGQGPGVLRTTFVSKRGVPIALEGIAVVQREGERPIALNAFLHDVTAERQSARVQAARFAVARVLAESPELGAALAQATEAIAANLDWDLAELWVPDATGGVLRHGHGWHRDRRPTLAAFTAASALSTFGHNEGLPGLALATREIIWEATAESRLFLRVALARQAGLQTAVAVPIVRDRAGVAVMVFFSYAPRPLDEPLAAVLADLGRQLGQFAARKAAEAELEAERASLARRVDERTAALSLANAALARAMRAKDEFMAGMSHELRTPLNTILAVSEVLLEQIRGPLNERQQSSIRAIETSGRHLLTLINDLLDLSKVEAGRLSLQPEPVSVAEICQGSLLFVKELAARKGLELTVQLEDEQSLMEADPRQLKQMLVNLLSNAVKFTPAGGKISLEVRTQPARGTISFTVADTGIGIAPEDQARLFQPFTQLDSRLSRQHEGTGLGLALVRRIAELHGGGVALTSEPGRGSRFTLTLPYSQPQTPQVSPAASELPSAAPRAESGPVRARARLLLAEDNESNIEVFGDYLRDYGYEVAVTRSGREALERALESRPELILLDIQMPEIDGLEVARRLRARPEFATIPIIALTALAMPGDRERCMAAGASAYLTKPVSLKALRGTIERLLAGQGAGAER